MRVNELVTMIVNAFGGWLWREMADEMVGVQTAAGTVADQTSAMSTMVVNYESCETIVIGSKRNRWMVAATNVSMRPEFRAENMRHGDSTKMMAA